MLVPRWGSRKRGWSATRQPKDLNRIRLTISNSSNLVFFVKLLRILAALLTWHLQIPIERSRLLWVYLYSLFAYHLATKFQKWITSRFHCAPVFAAFRATHANRSDAASRDFIA